MTKLRIRQIREASAKNSAHQAIIAELLETVEHLQSFTRRGVLPEPEPDLPPAAAKKKRSSATMEELQAFAKEQKMPASDGEFLFYHFEGKAWKDVKDWKAHFRKWKSAKWLPSQKVGINGGRPARTEPPGVTL